MLENVVIMGLIDMEDLLTREKVYQVTSGDNEFIDSPHAILTGDQVLLSCVNTGRYWPQVYQLPHVYYGPGKWEGSIVVRWICS